jgi:uncharacterized protein
MKIAFDPGKDARNIAKHGVSLALAEDLEWETALVWSDDRMDYGETRQCAIGYIGLRLFAAVFVDRAGARRIVSLRKANQREVKRYAKA